MKWSHLPAPGALYDQRPGLIDEWLIIMNVEGQEIEARQKAQENRMKKGRK